jgi:hypothetical protein
MLHSVDDFNACREPIPDQPPYFLAQEIADLTGKGHFILGSVDGCGQAPVQRIQRFQQIVGGFAPNHERDRAKMFVL